jgi:exonuclease SbcC
LKKLCKKIEFTEKQYDSLSKEIRDLEIKKGKLETTVEEMKKNKESLEEEEENSYKNLLDNMKLKGFNSYEIYKSSLMNEKDMKILKDDIQKFEGDLKKQESIYDEKFEKSKDLIFKSTDILEYEIKEMVSKREDLMKEINSLEIKIENLILKKDELKEIDSRMSDLSKIYSELNDLYEISIGKNSLRISLEKYVLSYYFDEILNYSNMRLEKFTEKRYSLHRSKESFDGRKNAGLDISVFDKYTGKEREAKSLSGGEIFIASLSLALGLSDVVQKNSGGVSLDTILIDEGFGSLDTNALDNAVEILMELQTSGRLIGIISHVSELKERIPDKIEIQKTKNGSYVKMEASNE